MKLQTPPDAARLGNAHHQCRAEFFAPTVSIAEGGPANPRRGCKSSLSARDCAPPIPAAAPHGKPEPSRIKTQVRRRTAANRTQDGCE